METINSNNSVYFHLYNEFKEKINEYKNIIQELITNNRNLIIENNNLKNILRENNLIDIYELNNLDKKETNNDYLLSNK
jgi:regulator of replication initiation timing